jgi:thiol-disulfide isomerase/thioredoxin
MKKIFYIILFHSFLFSNAQETNKEQPTINFLSTPFKEVLKQAAKEDKLIFIDCYTSWCAPCKWMDKYVFVEKDVFSFYNKSFINVKLDMEKGEGPEIGKKYGVKSYPTYLYINSKGELVHKSSSKMSATEFINEAKNALDPKKALGILEKRYEDGVITNNEMLDYVVALKHLRDPKTDEVQKKLLSRVDKAWLKSAAGWKLIENFVYEDDSELFQVLNSNKAHFIKLAGLDAVKKVYQKALQKKLYQSSKEQNEVLFFKQLDSLKKLTNNPRDLAISHCGYYLAGNNANEFTKTSNYYTNSFLQKDPETIAFIARQAQYIGKDNKEILKQSLVLIEKAYKMDPNNYGTVGTYAEIQSIMGNKKEALIAAEIAVKMADTISSKVKNRALQNLETIKKTN